MLGLVNFNEVAIVNCIKQELSKIIQLSPYYLFTYLYFYSKWFLGYGAYDGGFGGYGGGGYGGGGYGDFRGHGGYGGGLGLTHGVTVTNGGGTIGISHHGVTVKGPPTVPATIAGPAGKVVADGLYGIPTHHGHGWW